MTDMQPENNQVPVGLEQIPASPNTGGERIPVLPLPEQGLETNQERGEQAAEASAAASDAATVSTPAPVVLTTPTTDDSQATTTTSGPIAAADDDVIEKEWVDKAKHIILETKDDPHARTSKVNELQKDYLKKRYGKVLGASE